MTACEDIPDTVEITEQRELCQFDKGEVYRLNFNFLQATQPLEWRRLSRMKFRDLNYSAGKTVEISVLAEATGTVLENFNRWVKDQFGQQQLPSLATSPRVEMMGGSGYVLEVTGTFQGKPGYALIGAIVEREDGRLLTVKMTGERSEVLAEKERFLKFITTLRTAKLEEAE